MGSRAGFHLPGTADGAKEGWQERAVHSLDNQPRTKQEPNGVARLSSPVHWKFISLVRLAAEVRDISVAGYIRRAVAAFVAHDLEMSFGEILQFSPLPNRFGAGGVGKNALKPGWKMTDPSPPDDGTGFGKWDVSGD